MDTFIDVELAAVAVATPAVVDPTNGLNEATTSEDLAPAVPPKVTFVAAA